MSRVERTETPSERRGSDELNTQRGRQHGERRDDPAVGHTPGKAEGEERDVDEALREG